VKAVEAGTRITLKNILYLTDFSEPSEAALPFAAAIAREYAAKIHAFHVLLPMPYTYATPESTAASLEAQEEAVEQGMQRVHSELADLSHETIVQRAIGVWPSLDQAIKEYAIDLIVSGTHGRTGAQKLLLGSVAEEIFRRSRVPVLTIGPWAWTEVHNGAKFRRVLFATDFTRESLAAAPYAISMAQENQARLFLLHVMGKADNQGVVAKTAEESFADAIHRLHELVPPDAELWCRPEPLVEYGNPAERILEVAKDRDADLIVLGVRNAAGHLGVATHLERTTAHQIVAHASCPVLTVRG